MAAAIRPCNEDTIETHRKVIHPIFHFTAPEAGGKPKPYTQQSNRDRERFVPPREKEEEEDSVLLQPPMPPQFIIWVDKNITEEEEIRGSTQQTTISLAWTTIRSGGYTNRGGCYCLLY